MPKIAAFSLAARLALVQYLLGGGQDHIAPVMVKYARRRRFIT